MIGTKIRMKIPTTSRCRKPVHGRRLAQSALLAGLLLLTTACGSSRVGGSYLYDDAGNLKNSEIRMVTRPRAGNVDAAETRIVLCREGQITADVMALRGEGRGPLPLEVYAELWESIQNAHAFDLEVDPAKVDGGPYHVVNLLLGTEANQFSSQHHKSFIGFGTRDMEKRLEVSNLLARRLGEHVSLTPHSGNASTESTP